MKRFFKAGDIIKISMSPAKGHEQKGYRPAIVVSEESVHKYTGLIWVLPITNTDKGYPTHVAVEGRTKNKKTTGHVLCEKIKAIDPPARNAKLSDEAERELLVDCKKIIDAITYID